MIQQESIVIDLLGESVGIEDSFSMNQYSLQTAGDAGAII